MGEVPEYEVCQLGPSQYSVIGWKPGQNRRLGKQKAEVLSGQEKEQSPVSLRFLRKLVPLSALRCGFEFDVFAGTTKLLLAIIEHSPA